MTHPLMLDKDAFDIEKLRISCKLKKFKIETCVKDPCRLLLLHLHRRMRADNETTHPTSNSNALRIILSIFKCNNENYEQELRNNKLTDVCLTPSNTAY